MTMTMAAPGHSPGLHGERVNARGAGQGRSFLGWGHAGAHLDTASSEGWGVWHLKTGDWELPIRLVWADSRRDADARRRNRIFARACRICDTRMQIARLGGEPGEWICTGMSHMRHADANRAPGGEAGEWICTGMSHMRHADANRALDGVAVQIRGHVGWAWVGWPDHFRPGMELLLSPSETRCLRLLRPVPVAWINCCRPAAIVRGARRRAG
jgi:hypothetical protein